MDFAIFKSNESRRALLFIKATRLDGFYYLWKLLVLMGFAIYESY